MIRVAEYVFYGSGKYTPLRVISLLGDEGLGRMVATPTSLGLHQHKSWLNVRVSFVSGMFRFQSCMGLQLQTFDFAVALT